MNIKHFTHKGRRFFYGSGTHEEVESLNVEKDFDSALNTMRRIEAREETFLESKKRIPSRGKSLEKEKQVENDYREFVEILNAWR